jgi:hypothetical protein
MRTMPAARPLFGLVGDLTRETKIFIRQEIELAKTEVAEKLKGLTQGITSLLIGGFVAYAGVIVFLIGLGLLAAFALQKAGLDPLLAGFIGLGAIGLSVAGGGTLVLLKALKAFSAESLAPRRTLHTLQELRGHEPAKEKEHKEHSAPKRTSAQLEARVERTEDRMAETLEELGHRLNPKFISARFKGNLRQQPYRAGLIAMTVGLCSGWLLTRKLRKA